MSGDRVHPADRELLADDPLELHGTEVRGDADLMLRMLVEEYARTGFGLDALMDLARNPFYAGLHGLFLRHGEEGLRARIRAVLDRCGVLRVARGRNEE